MEKLKKIESCRHSHSIGVDLPSITHSCVVDVRKDHNWREALDHVHLLEAEDCEFCERCETKKYEKYKVWIRYHSGPDGSLGVFDTEKEAKDKIQEMIKIDDEDAWFLSIGMKLIDLDFETIKGES
jgi:hypothetical protein